MRAEDNRGFMVEQVLDGGKRGVNARFIGNIQICVQRDVKVAADEDFFAGNLDIFNGHFVQIHVLPLLTYKFISLFYHISGGNKS